MFSDVGTDLCRAAQSNAVAIPQLPPLAMTSTDMPSTDSVTATQVHSEVTFALTILNRELHTYCRQSMAL
jgi:hypothetical protein